MLIVFLQPEQELQTPVILDDSLHSPNTVSLQHGADYEDGLLDGAVLSLSMSEHAKAYPNNLQGWRGLIQTT